MHEFVSGDGFGEAFESCRVAPWLGCDFFVDCGGEAGRPIHPRVLLDDLWDHIFVNEMRLPAHVVCETISLVYSFLWELYLPNSVDICTSCPILEIVPVSPGS